MFMTDSNILSDNNYDILKTVMFLELATGPYITSTCRESDIEAAFLCNAFCNFCRLYSGCDCLLQVHHYKHSEP